MYAKKLLIGSNDVDQFLELKLSSFFKMMQDIATEHAEELDIGKGQTIDKGLYWVITRFSIDIINMPKYGCINVHASLLPKYRGAAPIQWAVINGDKVSGVTTMKMDVGLDTGDILEVAELELDKKETGGSLFDKLAGVGAKLLIKTLADLKDGKIEPKKQDEASASYVHMLKKSLGQIDFKNSAEEIERLIRGLNPWPSAYTSLDSKMLKIWDADLADQEELKLLGLSDSSDFEPGKIVAVSKNNIYVACGSGVLRLNELQAEGKKRMSCADFLKGHKIEAGRLI